jgi:hypothetical protein
MVSRYLEIGIGMPQIVREFLVQSKRLKPCINPSNGMESLQDANFHLR